MVEEHGDDGLFQAFLELDGGAVVVEKRVTITRQTMQLLIERRLTLRNEGIRLGVWREWQSTNIGKITAEWV